MSVCTCLCVLGRGVSVCVGVNACVMNMACLYIYLCALYVCCAYTYVSRDTECMSVCECVRVIYVLYEYQRVCMCCVSARTHVCVRE